MPTDSLGSFIDILGQYRLLEAEQLNELPRLQQQLPDPRALAKELVRRGWLTPYQANQLATGHVKNLALGPYLLLEKLGEGGMGQVYKARHQRLGRIDALKVIRKERLVKHDAVKRFYREIRAVAQLRHPNIVHAYDADEVEGTHYFSMEYVEGVDLAAYVKKHGPLPVAEACEYVRQAALGLQHAFERGLVHRDIKPQNLLIGHRPSAAGHRPETDSSLPKADSRMPIAAVKILDMGLARIEVTAADESSTVTREGTVMGTPDYIAPEQARSSHEVDIRADIYSLGCTFYFLLAGKPPFPGGSLTEKLLKHQLEEPEAIEQRRGDVPAEVAAVLRGMMAKHPEQRFQTPAQVVAALALVAQPSSPAPPPLPSFTSPNLSNSLEDALASTPPESQPDTLPLVVQLRQKRLARQKAWEKKVLAGACAVGALIMFVLLALVVRQFFSGRPDEPEPTPDAKTADEKPRPKRRDRAPSKEDLAAAERKRAAEAEQALAPIAAEAARSGADVKRVRRELQQFLMKHSATPAATKACELLGRVLAKSSSPLDQLDPKKIPDDARAAWQALGFNPPAELVAVFGEHRRRYPAAIGRVALSPDGKLLAIGGADRVIRLLNVATLQPRGDLKGLSPVFTADGRLWALSGTGIARWDVSGGTAKETVIVSEIPAAEHLTITRQGKLLATSHQDCIRLWEQDAEVYREKALLKWPGHINAIRFDAEGRRLIGGNHDKTVRIWDIQGAEPKDIATLQGHEDWVYDVAVSPDGKTLASVGAHDFTARLWDVSQVEAKAGAVIKLGVAGCSVAFSPDGKTLAIGLWNGPIWIMDLTADGPQLRHVLQGHLQMVWGLAFAPDAPLLVSGSEDRTFRLWNLTTRKEVQPMSGPVGPLNTVDFSTDERHLLTAGSDGAARIWQLKTGAEVGRVSSHSAWFVPGSTACVGIGTDGVARSFDAKQQARREYEKTPAVVISPSGYTGLMIDLDGLIKVWDLEAGKDLRRFGADGRAALPRYLAISPDSRRALSGDEKTVRLWDLDKGRELLQFDAIAVPDQGSIAFAPDGITALIGSGKSVTAHHVDTGEKVTDYEGQLTNVARAVFSPDGKVVASAAVDGRVLLWNAASGMPLYECQLPGPVHDLAFAPDGRHLATANANGTAYIFRIPPPSKSTH